MSATAAPAPPDGVRIISAWTKAGIASCVHVAGGMGPQEEILFDIGACNTSTLIAKSVFISHGHIDHIGAAIIHARMKSLQNQSSTYYIPEECYSPLLEAKAAFEKLDHSEIKMNLKVVKPGDIVEISKNLKCKVFETKHRVSSQGYALYRKLPGALLPQFQSLPPQEIAMLKNSGVQIKARESEKLEFVYTGDTTFDGLLLPENNFVFESPILFLECTYLDGEIKKAHEWGHIHLQEIITRASLFHNRMIILCHFSSRYSHSMVLNLLRQKLPLELACRVFVNLKGFGSEDELTRLIEIPFDVLESEPGYGWANTVTGYNRSGTSGGKSNTPLPPPPLPHTGARMNRSSGMIMDDDYNTASSSSTGNDYYSGGDFNNGGDSTQAGGFDKGQKRPPPPRLSGGGGRGSDEFNKGSSSGANDRGIVGRDASTSGRVPSLKPPSKTTNTQQQSGRSSYAAATAVTGTGYSNSSAGGYTDTVNYDAWGNPVKLNAATMATGYTPLSATAAHYSASGAATGGAAPYDASKYPYIASAIGNSAAGTAQQQGQLQKQQQQLYASANAATSNVYGATQQQAYPSGVATGYQSLTAQQQQYAYATALSQQQALAQQYGVQQQLQYPMQQVSQQLTATPQQQQYQYPLQYDQSQLLQQQSLSYFPTGASTSAYPSSSASGMDQRKGGKK